MFFYGGECAAAASPHTAAPALCPSSARASPLHARRQLPVRGRRRHPAARGTALLHARAGRRVRRDGLHARQPHRLDPHDDRRRYGGALPLRRAVDRLHQVQPGEPSRARPQSGHVETVCLSRLHPAGSAVHLNRARARARAGKGQCVQDSCACARDAPAQLRVPPLGRSRDLGPRPARGSTCAWPCACACVQVSIINMIMATGLAVDYA